ncbi:hypothetical protein B0T20DRAFT_401634 [Sordaria brevicollis]|uniref:Uncharacterized protein n=1 Tax=Sordaria brevicollis TaxID=83679 RepID=A0AAE0UEP1_SORBR|nr:hypothetical protein B0T20DRAFT_401634 [Sordaria brevicollis]
MDDLEDVMPRNGTRIPLAPKILHRFYEPIMLLEALRECVREHLSVPSQSVHVNVEDPKQLYQAFVYKLAHICDREKGGKTVTALMILNMNSLPAFAPEYTYVFAVNQATPEHLSHTASFLHTVLQKVALAPPATDTEGRTAAERELRQIVLRFNRPRMKFYLNSLRERAGVCYRHCEMSEDDESAMVIGVLTDLRSSEEFIINDMTPEAEYDQKCKLVFRKLASIFSDKHLNDIFLARAAAGRSAIEGYTTMSCWSDLVHTALRILAYRASVHYCFLARDRWPALFRKNPRIVAVPSADPQPTPRRNKSLKAEAIVGRMTSNDKLMNIFKRFVQDLQMIHLDFRLSLAYQKSPLIVHSEVLLHDWLLTDHGKGEIVPTMFFNKWPYIGSSKPTCKLCKYYFEESRSGVEHRASHGNLYVKWRLPDVYDFHGPEAVKRRQIMLDRILERVRKEVFNTIKKKSPQSYKHEDSNTLSATMLLDDRWTQTQTDPETDSGTRVGSVRDWAEDGSVIAHRADAEPAPGIINDVDSVKSEADPTDIGELRGWGRGDGIDDTDMRTHTGLEGSDYDDEEEDEEDYDDDDDDVGGAVL